MTLEVFGIFGETKIRILYKGEKLDVNELIRHAMLQDEQAEIDDVEVRKLCKVYENYYGSSAITFKYSDNGLNVTTMILPQLGVPMGLITLIIGFDPFIGMIKSACSCIEVESVMLSAERTEKQLDEETLNS